MRDVMHVHVYALVSVYFYCDVSVSVPTEIHVYSSVNHKMRLFQVHFLDE